MVSRGGKTQKQTEIIHWVLFYVDKNGEKDGLAEINSKSCLFTCYVRVCPLGITGNCIKNADGTVIYSEPPRFSHFLSSSRFALFSKVQQLGLNGSVVLQIEESYQRLCTTGFTCAYVYGSCKKIPLFPEEHLFCCQSLDCTDELRVRVQIRRVDTQYTVHSCYVHTRVYSLLSS